MADNAPSHGDTAVTDAEWREFQALPARDSAQRAWLDTVITTRVAAARETAVNDATLALHQARVTSPRTLYIDDAQVIVGRLLRQAYLARTMAAQKSPEPSVRPTYAAGDQLPAADLLAGAAPAPPAPRWTAEQIDQQVRESAAIAETFRGET